MDSNSTPPTVTTVAGVTDTRGLSLVQLAGEHATDAANSLRNILPPEDVERLPVCAFGSSI